MDDSDRGCTEACVSPRMRHPQDDFKHFSRKLTHKFTHDGSGHRIQDLTMTLELQASIEAFIDKYFSEHHIYSRRKK
jgi:hypothetical protein